MAILRTLSLALASITALSCSAARSVDGLTNPGSNDAGSDAASFLDSAQQLDSNIETGSTSAFGEVYAHSATQLYRLDPLAKSISVIGTFDCVVADTSSGFGMWDIAVDKDGRVFGSVVQASGSQLVRIDKTNASCSTVATAADLPNSLTFVPAGVLDPVNETLVGYSGSTYLRIDKTTGTATVIGNLNPNATGKSWSSSGDIVSVIGTDTYLTAVQLDATTPSIEGDFVLQVDPKTGRALKVVGPTHFSQLWGLGFWAGTAYGFGATGELCAIDLATGAGSSLVIPGLPEDTQFWGAGVTTAAPIVVPK